MEFERAIFRAGLVGILLIPLLSGCPTGPHAAGTPPATAVGQTTTPAAPAAPPRVDHPQPGQVPAHKGHPYDVASRESLLTILAFRGGALAKAGHNHVIASRDVTGTIYVSPDALSSTFEIHVPVAQLTIDEPQLRALEGPDFPTDVPDSAKEGTRRNMLSEALLNGAQYPDITLVCQRITAAAAGAPMGANVQADVQVTIRGQVHSLSIPMHYDLGDGQLVVSGELPIKQTDLGLTPFSAMLGALAVQDELRVRFHIVAHAAKVRGPEHKNVTVHE